MKVYFEKPAPPPIRTSWLGGKLDAFFEAVAPGYARSRMQARRDLSQFALRAARPTLDRQLAGFGPHPNSATVQRDAVALMFEARDLAENVGFVKGHLRKTQLYGAGTLSYEPETGDAGMDSEITGFFDWFNEHAHIGGEHTLTRLFQLALMGMTRDRDSMLCFVRDPDDGLLRLQIVEADQIGELFSYTTPRPDYIQGVFMDGPRRLGYRVYDRVGDMQYANPQFVPAHDALFFFDPMRNSVRGITAYETSIQNIRDKFEILGYEKVTVKEISETGVVTYTQRGQAGGFDYDREEVAPDTGEVSYIKHSASGTREYMGIGERFDVVPHNRPSPTFQGFIKTLDMEDCMGLNLPYGFVVDPTESGGAVTRLIAHVANREFGRVQHDVLRPQLNRLRTIILADAMEHGLISRHPKFRNGFWMFPPPPTADVERESDISIREVRSGLSTRTGEWAMQGGSFRKKVQILKQEAVARRVAAIEATEELKTLGYADQTVSPDEIYANSDNPAVTAGGNEKAMEPAAGQTQLSAYAGDVAVGSLPAGIQAEIRRFTSSASTSLRVIRYGMVVAELLPKADPANLRVAREKAAAMDEAEAAEFVMSRMANKAVLLMNDRIIDGHHFLAAAERGGVSASLTVIDLSPVRFQLSAQKNY